MTSDDDAADFLEFDDEPEDEDIGGPGARTRAGSRPWRVFVVDDDPEIHTVTKMVLADTSFRGRPLEILSAYSAAEADKMLRTETDIAMILLDVVMETDDAGLRLVKTIRNDIPNDAVRIVLRTGQPGQAPEREVIVEYDINDYKSKTELTAQKLYTVVIAALRSYEHLVAIENSRQGLEKIIESSATLQRRRSMELFADGVLMQMSYLLSVGIDAILCAQVGEARKGENPGPNILAGSGRFSDLANQLVDDVVDQDVSDAIHRTIDKERNLYEDEFFTLWIKTPNARKAIVYVKTPQELSEVDRQLIEVFCSNISVGFDNVYLFEQLRKAHEATVVALADLAEFKDTDTGAHVLRVAHTTDAIAQRLRAEGHFNGQIDDFFQELVGMASILHDVGKVGIPDSILQKPAKLDADEREVMEKHAPIGGSILSKAGDLVDGVSYLSLGAEIAANHHEKYDGSGYPGGLRGEGIPLSARIVAVADVYDALTHKRPYKDPWPHDKAVEALREGRGTHFDPVVLDTFLKILEENPDLVAQITPKDAT